ncbi:hypothetical protein STAFG_3516 [Streptomyces afghaniensis 772]|uniref:Uncharacterized protein n=1 Tax=Streptomyces afghaniensis 772 TaxID=1283301 RepID=S4MUN9_9ACTN|nr:MULTISPECIES: hypothetical protein [Streptomyces]EPJ39440.1 hypothetical protein STAFG_3516 [Streptomyces afghaniensis 772]UOB15907.1 hypothetical protein MQE23_25960 [Streptomyces sp. HP-A2021]
MPEHVSRWPEGHSLPALPQQRQTGPRSESAELTPEERDAFAELVRRLGDKG